MHPQSSRTQPIGVAVAGLGFGEAVHLPALASNPDLNAVALWHPRQDRLDLACASHNLQGTTDWDLLLANPEVEAVIITTPPAPRFDLARRALEAGKHLLLEKPVALEAERVEELQRIAIAYLIASLIVLFGSGRRAVLASIALLLLGYWAILIAYGGESPYALETNAVRIVDLHVLGAAHMYSMNGVPFDPRRRTGQL